MQLSHLTQGLNLRRDEQNTILQAIDDKSYQMSVDISRIKKRREEKQEVKAN